MERFENKYQSLLYNEDKSLVVQKWTKDSLKLDSDSFKKEMLFLADFFNRYHPQKVLILMQDFEFIVDTELQDWVNQNINSILAEDKTHTAFVVSKDFFTAVSVEQTLSDAKHTGIQNKFFADEDEARKWLGL